MRFHLDEHIHSAVASGLRLRGIDVTTTVEAGLCGANDEDHISHGNTEGRVIVTNDADFLRIHAEGVPHAGIAYWPQGTRSIGQIVDALALLDGCLSSAEMQGRVEHF